MSQQITCARIALRRHGGPMQDENDCACEHCVALRELIDMVRARPTLPAPEPPPERISNDVTRSDDDGARASDVLGEASERSDPPSVAGDRAESEKERRTHYQDIVYGILARLETLTGERNTQATRAATLALLERAVVAALSAPEPPPDEPIRGLGAASGDLTP